MAKLDPYKRTVDYRSEIQVNSRSGLGSAAQSNLQVANIYGNLGSEFSKLVVDDLQETNIKNAAQLASQIKFGTKTLETEIDGNTVTVDMPTIIKPDGETVRGESGRLAYQKILAKNFTNQLKNDLLTITETEANNVESRFGSMEEFATIVTTKHDLIYEQLPVEIANELRTEAEKKIIQRGARVQNVFLNEQNARTKIAWDSSKGEIEQNIINSAMIGDTESATNYLNEYENHFNNGMETNVIRDANEENKTNSLSRMSGLVSAYKLINPHLLDDLNTNNISLIQQSVSNTEQIINLLNTAPGIDSANLLNLKTSEVTTLTRKQFSDLIKNPKTREDLAVDLNRRLSYLKDIVSNYDKASAGLNLTQDIINNSNAGITGRDYTKKEMDQINPYENRAFIERFNAKHNKKLTVENAKDDINYMIHLATHENIMHPDFKSKVENNFKNFDEDYITQMIDNGFLPSLKYYIHTDGEQVNRLYDHFNKDLAADISQIINLTEVGIPVKEIAETFKVIQGAGNAQISMDLNDAAKELKFDDFAHMKKDFANYYMQTFQGVGPGEGELHALHLARQYASRTLTRAIQGKDFDLANYIDDIETNRSYRYSKSQDGYIFNPKAYQPETALYKDQYVMNTKAPTQFGLPPHIEGKGWDYKKEFNLDYLKDPIGAMFSRDARGKKHWETIFDASLKDGIDSEFRKGGRIKMVPTGLNQQYPTYYIGQLNDNGMFDFVLDPNGEKAILNPSTWYIPAYRNLMSGNQEFRELIANTKYLDANGKPQNPEQVDLDSWNYYLNREFNQFVRGFNNMVIPDGEVTTGEVIGAGSTGVLAPILKDVGTKTINLGGKGVTSIYNFITGKQKIFTPYKSGEINFKKLGSKKAMALRAASAIALWSSLSVYGRDIEEFYQKKTSGLDTFQLNDAQALGQIRYWTEKDRYNIPEYIEQAYLPSTAPYIHTEDLDMGNGNVIPKGTSSTLLMGAEVHPDLGWIVFPHIRTIDGERQLLSTEDAIEYAIGKKDYIQYNTQEEAIRVSVEFSDTVDYWRNNPNQEWWLKGIHK